MSQGETNDSSNSNTNIPNTNTDTTTKITNTYKNMRTIFQTTKKQTGLSPYCAFPGRTQSLAPRNIVTSFVATAPPGTNSKSTSGMSHRVL